MDSYYTTTKKVFLFLVVVLIVGGIWFLNSRKVDVRGGASAVDVTTVDQLATSTLVTDTTTASSTSSTQASASVSSTQVKAALMKLAMTDKAAGFSVAKEITNPSGFVNTGKDASGSPLPITISQYIGKKVILIDFWTYSCINCQRTQPYLNTWYDKYEDKGLVIIGVHTPEFDFEKVHDNVVKAVAKEGIKYPVVQDNDYGTWSAYGNQYWPRKYLIDMAGYVVYDKIGEGGYVETEEKIQDLLMQRADILGTKTSGIDTTITTPTDAVTSIETQSPETYFGSARNEYLGNGIKGQSGQQNFSLQHDISNPFEDNALYLGGYWNIYPEYAQTESDGQIIYTFDAKEVYFVAGSNNSAGSDIDVLLDGTHLKTLHITGDTLYHLIDLPKREKHTLEIRAKAGLKAFTFTFG